MQSTVHSLSGHSVLGGIVRSVHGFAIRVPDGMGWDPHSQFDVGKSPAGLGFARFAPFRRIAVVRARTGRGRFLGRSPSAPRTVQNGVRDVDFCILNSDITLLNFLVEF